MADGKGLIFFLFLSGYPCIFLKSDTSPIRGSWLSLLTSTFLKNQIYIFIPVKI
jgi:hypothetical protein